MNSKKISSPASYMIRLKCQDERQNIIMSYCHPFHSDQPSISCLQKHDILSIGELCMESKTFKWCRRTIQWEERMWINFPVTQTEWVALTNSFIWLKFTHGQQVSLAIAFNSQESDDGRWATFTKSPQRSPSHVTPSHHNSMTLAFSSWAVLAADYIYSHVP